MPDFGYATSPLPAEQIFHSAGEIFERNYENITSTPGEILNFIKSNSQPKGGKIWHEPIVAPSGNDNVVIETGFESVDDTYKRAVSGYQASMKTWNNSVNILPLEIDFVQTGMDIVDLIQTQIDGTMEVYKSTEEGVFLSDGTYASNGFTSGKAPLGLKKIVSADEYGLKTDGTKFKYNDILDADGNPAWTGIVNPVPIGATSFNTGTGGTALSLGLLQAMRNAAAKRNGRPDTIITSYELYSTWEKNGMAFPQNMAVRSNAVEPAAPVIPVFGGYRWIVSQHSGLAGDNGSGSAVANTYRLYMIDPKHIKIYHNPRRDGMLGDFQSEKKSEPMTAIAKYSREYCIRKRNCHVVATCVAPS